ncbi:MTAP family purine nucleoside phosphorylase [Neobacillus sedimentimangrovi]|jgi:5'-methylthioadenosine phosphorylase|uniref:Purine nucleoside phosphorylase n=1 Tax=Neobacillus sedimentimangrovi TaxID=2699460 RepID=A0ABS8QH91_9BACI|nr:MTAP family purine nucleoside phosphorylase [Neobacillus sedimentimangrovi]MCD4838637.1 MTAP family purine nucleoside phosphorylase [Neobacillus sedimentimangrovi]
MKIGVIGGTGFYDLLKEAEKIEVTTEFGVVPVFKGEHANKEVYFLPRHGENHHCLAHEVNYRANMLALKQLGVNHVLAMCAVGSLNPEIPVGHFALLDDFVDVTTNRVKTYGKYSVDISRPYDEELRQYFMEAARQTGIELTPKATYITVDGPRYETSAEIKLYRSWGMDVVGMTNGTEASLARELGIAYAVVTLATDMAAGMTDVAPDLEMHRSVVKNNKEKMIKLFLKTIELVETNGKSEAMLAYERAIEARKDKLAATKA